VTFEFRERQRTDFTSPAKGLGGEVSVEATLLSVDQRGTGESVVHAL
jgi:hypothetical protein